MKGKKSKSKAKSRRRRSRPKTPLRVFYLCDTKGEVFDIHESREDAWHDAVGPRFFKGFYIVEYARRGTRRYDYKSSSLKEVRRAGR